MAGNYKDIAAIALQRREKAIPEGFMLPERVLEKLPRNVTNVLQSSGRLTPEGLEMINADAPTILSNIKDKTWTALDVINTFSISAVAAQQLTNCVTEILFEEAFSRAQFLDNYLRDTGEVIGPLHGLPISLKDCMVTPPHPSSIGMAHYANGSTQPEEETLLVTILRKLGAVIYVKTNTPTAMMMMETINHVWGETTNPYHSGSSAGGSSGGEGALLALRGSPLGIGTDIGGSIRIPSAYNNLFGLKPTYGRFPVYGTRSGIMGQDFICSINGPMSRSLETLKVYCRALLSTEVSPWTLDPKILPIPWREDVIQPKGRKLRFGIVSDNDGQVSAHPPIVRGLKMTKAALEAAGHEVFEWTPTDHPEMAEVVNSSFHTLGGAAILELTRMYGEPVYGSMKAYEESYNRGEDGTLGPTKLRQMIIRRNALQKAYLDRWNATANDGKPAMDGIIMAASPWTAPRLGITQKLFNVNYTIVFNLLDYPVCTFPVTFADKNLDPSRTSWTSLNEKDAAIHADYDPEFYDGTPVVLQCVGRRMEDEKVLEMVQVISGALDSSRKVSVK